MYESSKNEAPGLEEYLRALRSRWWIVILTLVVGFVGASLFANSRTPSYEAAAMVTLGSTPAGGSITNPAQPDPATEADKLKSTAIATAVANKVAKGEDPDKLLGGLNVAYLSNRNVLDLKNGAIATGFFANAGIPQGSLVDPSNPPAYRFADPSQLTPCDDYFVMPHADPTYATHKQLIAFNDQGGYIWAGCHAVSVLELIRLNDAPANPLVMNFLTDNGLKAFGSHSGGSVPYEMVPRRARHR